MANLDLHKKKKTVAQLCQMFKVDKQDKEQHLQTLKRIMELSEQESAASVKDLRVPQHLLCPISGDLMDDPVTLESGQTFEREMIEKYFEAQREKDQEQINNQEEERTASTSSSAPCHNQRSTLTS